MLSLYDRIGGMSVIEKVQKIFYDKVYNHNWLGLYFKHIDQKHIESQQAKFMSGLMGGPKIYMGSVPKEAHRIILATNELFDVRKGLLIESLKEANIGQSEIDEWIKKDEAFRSVIVKKSISDCKKVYDDEEIIYYEKP
ncbi:MAG: group 1 truncated hemoglobin [Spirochaetia bacterium]|nr:group 1 truncated hemoglobin [Spirochaetia bacterium]